MAAVVANLSLVRGHSRRQAEAAGALPAEAAAASQNGPSPTSRCLSIFDVGLVPLDKGEGVVQARVLPSGASAPLVDQFR
jgi:hypothetical protein